MIKNFDLTNGMKEILSSQELAQIHKEVHDPKARLLADLREGKSSSSSNLMNKARNMKDMEILIPVRSGQKFSVEQDKAKLFKLIKTEFASRFLEKLGMDVTSTNIARLYQNLGKDFFVKHCNITIKKGLKHDVRYFSITPSMSGVKRQQANTEKLKQDAIMEDFGEMKEMLKEAPPDDESINMELFDFDSFEGDLEPPTGHTDVESFDDYHQRYVYPYNVFKNQMEKKGPSTVDHLQNNFKVSIYQLLHGHPKHSARKHSKRHSSVPLSARSNNFEYYLTLPSNQTKRKDIFTAGDAQKIRARYGQLFDDSPDAGNELIVLYDKELMKPPFMERSEVRNVQQNFTKTFPFDMWESKIPNPIIQSVKKSLVSFRLTDFIRNYCNLCYWTFLSEFGESRKKSKDLEEQFLNVYDDILKLIQENSSKQSQIITLPVTLLCIRITSESIFSICYPQFWNSVLGTNLSKRMDILITFLLDPQLYLSQFAPIEVSNQTRRLKQKYEKQNKNSNYGKRINNRATLLSPLVKFILGQDAKSLGTRKLLKKDPTTLDYGQDVIHELFKSDTIKSKLLAIMMKQKVGKRQQGHTQMKKMKNHHAQRKLKEKPF